MIAAPSPDEDGGNGNPAAADEVTSTVPPDVRGIDKARIGGRSRVDGTLKRGSPAMADVSGIAPRPTARVHFIITSCPLPPPPPRARI